MMEKLIEGLLGLAATKPINITVNVYNNAPVKGELLTTLEDYDDEDPCDSCDGDCGCGCGGDCEECDFNFESPALVATTCSCGRFADGGNGVCVYCDGAIYCSCDGEDRGDGFCEECDGLIDYDDEEDEITCEGCISIEEAEIGKKYVEMWDSFKTTIITTMPQTADKPKILKLMAYLETSFLG